MVARADGIYSMRVGKHWNGKWRPWGLIAAGYTPRHGKPFCECPGCRDEARRDQAYVLGVR